MPSNERGIGQKGLNDMGNKFIRQSTSSFYYGFFNRNSLLQDNKEDSPRVIQRNKGDIKPRRI